MAPRRDVQPVRPLWLSRWPDTPGDPGTAGAHRMTTGIARRAALRHRTGRCPAAPAPAHTRRGGCDDRPGERDRPWKPTGGGATPAPAMGSIKAKNGMVSLNCCDELHFWKQVFDGTQLVKELYGHPICQQLTRRPDMIGQTRCHRWGHGSPRTP